MAEYEAATGAKELALLCLGLEQLLAMRHISKFRNTACAFNVQILRQKMVKATLSNKLNKLKNCERRS